MKSLDGNSFWIDDFPMVFMLPRSVLIYLLIIDNLANIELAILLSMFEVNLTCKPQRFTIFQK